MNYRCPHNPCKNYSQATRLARASDADVDTSAEPGNAFIAPRQASFTPSTRANAATSGEDLHIFAKAHKHLWSTSSTSSCLLIASTRARIPPIDARDMAQSTSPAKLTMLAEITLTTFSSNPSLGWQRAATSTWQPPAAFTA